MMPNEKHLQEDVMQPGRMTPNSLKRQGQRLLPKRQWAGLSVLLLFCLMIGCTPLRPIDDYPTVTVSKGPAEPLPTLSAPEQTVSFDSPAIASAETADTQPAANETLTQAGTGSSQGSSTTPAWRGMMNNLSTVLQSEDTTGKKKMVVPDPTEPAAPQIDLPSRRQDEPAANQQNAAANLLPDQPFVDEAIATPDGSAPITLQLNGVDAKQALQMLSSEAKVNLLVSDGVSGTVTANLRGMTFEEALNSILRLCNLVAHREGNNIFIYPAEDLPQLDRVFKVIPLDYASAEDVLNSIKEMKGLLSPVGAAYAFVTDDPSQAAQDDVEGTTDNRRTQEAIVVEDTPNHVARVEQYLREVDVPPRQVQIQAYILQVDLKNDLKHGVNFEEIIKIAGNTATLKTVGFANTKATEGFLATIDGKNFDAVLEALKTTTDAKTLAEPKVIVLNGQLSHIQIGERLGYRDTTTQTETAATQSVKFLELGVVLDVTPRITADQRVLMTVQPKISDGLINAITELPEEQTTQLVTNVLLNNGQGMVIGGLIKEKDSNVQGKIPFLGDLPYAGLLFQSRKKETERSEIIIALIPHVLPYPPCVEARDQLETIRATTPLLHGPLRRCPRPWEPSLQDALPMRGDRL